MSLAGPHPIRVEGVRIRALDYQETVLLPIRGFTQTSLNLLFGFDSNRLYL